MNLQLSSLYSNPTARKYGGIALIFLLGTAVGRYTLPAKVVTKTEVQTVTKVVKDTNRDKKDNTVTTIVETKKPDGTIVKQTQIVDQNQTITQTNTNSNTNSNSTYTQKDTRDVGQLGVNALVGLRLGTGEPLSYGLSVQRRLLGPVEIGAFGFTDKLVGFSLGLRF
jgi:hypothetical protein